MSLGKKCVAECLGTFWLVFGGCGSAVLAAVFAASLGSTPISLGIGFVGVSFAFGLTVLTMAYTIGHISGCHLNPAVTLGLTAGGRFKSADVVPYIASQVVGAILGADVLYVFASGNIDFKLADGFASNGYEQHSPGKYRMVACFVAEAVLTFFFLFIIHGATDKRAPAGLAPIAIGLGLTLIQLIGIRLPICPLIQLARPDQLYSSEVGRLLSFGYSGLHRLLAQWPRAHFTKISSTKNQNV